MSKIILFIFFQLLITNIWAANDSNDIDDGNWTSSEYYYLTDEQIKVYEKKALLGSGEYALKLSIFHNLISNNKEKRFYWALIGAENGNIGSIYTMSYLFLANIKYINGSYVELNEISPEDRYRGCFWLKKYINLESKNTKKKIKLKNNLVNIYEVAQEKFLKTCKDLYPTSK